VTRSEPVFRVSPISRYVVYQQTHDHKNKRPEADGDEGIEEAQLMDLLSPMTAINAVAPPGGWTVLVTSITATAMDAASAAASQIGFSRTRGNRPPQSPRSI